MEIRDPVHGTISLSDAETTVIDTPEYQRLRQIKQLGFSEFSFPGATHNRYLHSIGVSHIAGLAFEQIFKAHSFSKNSVKENYKQVLKLAALLHDIGHGPLSHTIEDVMPPLADLKIKAYLNRRGKALADQTANHEDYTIKYITDSHLSETLKKAFPDFDPYYIACLLDKTLDSTDDFFIDQGIDFRPILSQLVSSELDCDRMDYLERDSYFCGTNYGKFDLLWMLNSLRAHQVEDKFFMAINRRALYTFDDFLISRHHMHLMVYFHHKSIIYEEMLNRYLTSQDCSFHLPADINEYTSYTDYKLYEHLASQSNPWAQRIAERRPYKVLTEIHSTAETGRPKRMKEALEAEGIDVIWASSSARLSKYHSAIPEDRAYQIFVVDTYDRWDKPTPIDKSTDLFQRYEGARIIDRLYVSPEDFKKAEKLLISRKL
jgi:uncharacterized protein